MPKKTKNADLIDNVKKTRRTEAAIIASTTPVEVKAAILDDAKAEILNGRTLQQIADKHKIGRSTLSLWLSQLPDGQYEQLRSLWIDQQLQDAVQNIEKAPDALELARGRELLRHSQWLSERRDSRYQTKQQVTNITLDLTAAISAGRARAGITIDQE